MMMIRMQKQAMDEPTCISIEARNKWSRFDQAPEQDGWIEPKPDYL